MTLLPAKRVLRPFQVFATVSPPEGAHSRNLSFDTCLRDAYAGTAGDRFAVHTDCWLARLSWRREFGNTPLFALTFHTFSCKYVEVSVVGTEGVVEWPDSVRLPLLLAGTVLQGTVHYLQQSPPYTGRTILTFDFLREGREG